MGHATGASSRGLRWGCFGLAAVIALLAVTVDPADARSRTKRVVKKAAPAQLYRPPYAAIVIDGNTGATLHQESADAVRHPASLTKIMTLYLLFEQLDAGKLRLDSQMEVSAAAAAQAPTKLGLQPGQTIRVEDAIKGLITKSANDAAVVVAEALAGSEDEFARRMTRQARALGMSRTVYRNASGLPDDQQITTARDQALLGLAIQERFPRYYRYFSTTSFAYRGKAMRNHNRLLGRVDGVDGIKTGYIRASGFNLTTSMRRGHRHIVAVVLGGRSGPQRDARMRELILDKISLASAKPAAAASVAAVSTPAAVPLPPTPPLVNPQQGENPVLESPLPFVSALAGEPRAITLASSEATAAIPSPILGSDAPIRPIPVRTYSVKLVPTKSNAQKPDAAVAVEPAIASPAITAPVPAAPSATKPAVEAASSETARPEAPKLPRGTWVIQVGAFEDLDEAKERLASAQSKAGPLLGKASRYTERTTKGEKTYYRARFAGFDRDAAQQVCRQLKRSDIDCMALRI